MCPLPNVARFSLQCAWKNFECFSKILRKNIFTCEPRSMLSTDGQTDMLKSIQNLICWCKKSWKQKCSQFMLHCRRILYRIQLVFHSNVPGRRRTSNAFAKCEGLIFIYEARKRTDGLTCLDLEFAEYLKRTSGCCNCFDKMNVHSITRYWV